MRILIETFAESFLFYTFLNGVEKKSIKLK
jgi:hypothetical protein